MNEAAILILSIGVYFTIRSIIRNSRKRRVKKAVKKYNSTDFDNNNIKKYGLKLQGKCYSFSCPLCYEADEEYCEDNGIQYYLDMVVVEVELLKELES